MSRAEREERIAYARRGKRSITVPKARDLDEEAYARRSGVGGNGAPRYDPDAPVTGFPYVMGDIKPFRFDDGTEITSRSGLREYQRRNQVEQIGLDWSASSDVGKPWWFDQYKAHRRENEKRTKQGKKPVKWTQPEKPKTKAEKIAVSTKGVHDAKTMRKIA
jgi:hypothetical protein